MALRRAVVALGTNLGEVCSTTAPAAAAARRQGCDLAQAAAAPASSSSWQVACLQQQRGHIAVDVHNGNVDKALRTLTRKLKEENYMKAAQDKEWFSKPSEKRKEAATLARKKFRKAEFREMLQWILRRKSRGF